MLPEAVAGGVAQVPSPRRKVVESGVPEPNLSIGTVPVDNALASKFDNPEPSPDTFETTRVCVKSSQTKPVELPNEFDWLNWILPSVPATCDGRTVDKVPSVVIVSPSPTFTPPIKVELAIRDSATVLMVMLSASPSI